MYNFINLKEYNYSEKYQQIEMVVLSLASFFIPLFLGHQQLLVGSIVNAFLILSAMHLKGWRILPVIIMPSLGALSAGLIFGPLTNFLLLMIPFIWIGNSLLVFSFRRFKISYWLKLLIAAASKAGFLFAAAFILYSLGALPVLFLTTMGIFQLYTALIGGIIAFGYEKIQRFLTI